MKNGLFYFHTVYIVYTQPHIFVNIIYFHRTTLKMSYWHIVSVQFVLKCQFAVPLRCVKIVVISLQLDTESSTWHLVAKNSQDLKKIIVALHKGGLDTLKPYSYSYSNNNRTSLAMVEEVKCTYSASYPLHQIGLHGCRPRPVCQD